MQSVISQAPGAPAGLGGRTCLVRGADDRLHAVESTGVQEIGERLHDTTQLVWLDIDTPSAADIELLRDTVGIHPLAIEDLERREQRPKLDVYPTHSVIVTYEPRRSPAPPDVAAVPVPDDIELAEVHLYIGESFVVSIHWGASPAVGATQARFRANAASIGSGVGTLLYTILDAVVDGYFPVVDAYSDEIDDLADRIVEQPSAQTLREVLALKRRLLELRRILAPQREVANSLLRRDTLGFIEERALPYFQDLFDHLLRVLDSIDLYRDLLAATLDTQVSVTSNSLNVVMRRLTAFTVLLMVPTLIAGVYGMNFTFMPELEWAAGYPFALGLMVATMTAIAVFFWRHKWF